MIAFRLNYKLSQKVLSLIEYTVALYTTFTGHHTDIALRHQSKVKGNHTLGKTKGLKASNLEVGTRQWSSCIYIELLYDNFEHD